MVVTNIALSVIGSVGNFLVCITIALTPKLRIQSCILIVNLAAADLLATLVVEPMLIGMLLCIINETCLINIEELNRAARFLANLSLAVSLLTLTVMSIERCVTILSPLKYRKIITPTHFIVVIVYIWLSSFVAPIMDTFVTHRLTYIYTMLAALFIVYTVMIICYCLIFCKVHKQNNIRAELANGKTTSHKPACEKRLAKTIALVAGTFTIFWAPFTFHLMNSPLDNCGSAYAWMVTAIFLNSATNPLIYCYRGKVFRKSLMDILRRFTGRQRRIMQVKCSTGRSSRTTQVTDLQSTCREPAKSLVSMATTENRQNRASNVIILISTAMDPEEENGKHRASSCSVKNINSNSRKLSTNSLQCY